MAKTTARRRRSYSRSGMYATARAAPGIVARAADESVPDGDLTVLESAGRSLWRELVDALGGPGEVTPQQHLVLHVVVSRAIIAGTVQRYIVEELGGSIIDRRAKRIRRLALDLLKVEDGLIRAVQTLGLDRKQPSFAEYLARQARQDAPCGAIDADVDAAAAARKGAEGSEPP